MIWIMSVKNSCFINQLYIQNWACSIVDDGMPRWRSLTHFGGCMSTMVGISKFVQKIPCLFFSLWHHQNHFSGCKWMGQALSTIWKRLALKSDNLRYVMLGCWVAGTNDSSTNYFIFHNFLQNCSQKLFQFLLFFLLWIYKNKNKEFWEIIKKR